MKILKSNFFTSFSGIILNNYFFVSILCILNLSSLRYFTKITIDAKSKYY